MKFYKKFSSFKAYFSNFGPRKSVNFCIILEDQDTHVSNCQIQRNSFTVLQRNFTQYNQLTKKKIFIYKKK